jgi:tRNA(Leu) C34 or U34 (ribose-2'-O)-methylase TrmL
LALRQWLVKRPWAVGDTTALAAHGGSLNLANRVAIALVEAWRQVDFAGAT